MSLSEGLLTVTADITTKYIGTAVASTNYLLTSSSSTNYVIDNILLGLFLGKQNVVESGYVVDGYFAGAEII